LAAFVPFVLIAVDHLVAKNDGPNTIASGSGSIVNLLSEVRFASASELRLDLHDCGFVPTADSHSEARRPGIEPRTSLPPISGARFLNLPRSQQAGPQYPTPAECNRSHRSSVIWEMLGKNWEEDCHERAKEKVR
jgi:hypothetical protein